MALATLSIDLEARLARFEAGMDRAGRLLEKLGAGATTAGRRVGEIFAGNLLADAAGQALQRLVTFFPQVADGVLAIKDLAEATGSSVESISALDDVARRAGSNLGEVEQVLIKFNMALKDADGKNGISQALKAIGLDAKELRSLDPAEALQRAAVALNGFADNGDRARVTQELFGKGVKVAAALLRDLAEAGQLNATVTTAQAEEVDKFSKNMAGLRTNISDVARILLTDLVPALNGAAAAYSNTLKRASGKTFLEELTSEVQGARLSLLVARIEALSGAVAKDPNNGALVLALSKARTEYEGLSRAAAAANEQLKTTLGIPAPRPSAGGGRGFVNPELVKPSVADIFGPPAKLKESKVAFEDYSASLTKGLADLIERTPTVRLAELNAQLERLTQLSGAGLDPKIVDDVRRMLSPPMGPNLNEPLNDRAQRLQELMGQTNSAQLASASRDAKALSDELSSTPVGTQRWLELQEALFDTETRVTELSGTFTAFIERSNKGTAQLAATIEGTLGYSFSSALRGDFKSIGNMWKNLLFDMASRALAANLADQLFGAVGSNGARAGGGWVDMAIKFFGSASANARGNAFGSAGVIPFATGGVVSGATPFTFGGGRMGVMGEAGEEGILPLKRGRDGKLGVTTSGGARPVVFNNTFNVNGDVSSQTVQLMQAMIDRSNARLMRSMRTGSAGA